MSSLDTLIITLMTFIHGNVDLPVPKWLPVVQTVSVKQVFHMKYPGRSYNPDRAPLAVALPGGFIYLTPQVDLETVAGKSVLVHELVHYMQDQAGMTYECQGDKERLAFNVQDAWLTETLGQQTWTEDVLPVGPLWLVAQMACPWPESMARPGEAGP